MMISAYLLHAGIKPHAEAALIEFGQRRTANAKGVTIASQMRWVHYYDAILKRGAPLVHTYHLTHLRLRGVPCPGGQSDGCTPYFVLLVDNVKVFDFRAWTTKVCGGKLPSYRRGEPYVDFDLTEVSPRVPLTGNVKLAMLAEGGLLGAAVKLCHLWFHTGFVTHNYLSFPKRVIDKASKDKRGVFPPNFAIEMLLERVEGGGVG